MKKIITTFALSLLSAYCYAEVSTIAFKQENISHNNYGSYAALICGLVIAVILFLAFTQKKKRPLPSACRILETKHLNSKTVLYCVEFEGQRVMIVENNHGINMQLLAPGQKHDLL